MFFVYLYSVFVLRELTGLDVTTEAACLEAVDLLHSKGVKTVVVTSGVAEAGSDIKCYASTKNGWSPFSCPVWKTFFDRFCL